MVYCQAQAKKHTFSYFLGRGIFILLVAAGVDTIIWQNFPFIGMDVLYLIAISLPLTYLLCRLNLPGRWAVIIFIFCLAPILQACFGYQEAALSLPLSWPNLNLGTLARSWFINGWFPIFPWIGFAFLGTVLPKLRSRPTILLITGIITLAAGSLMWARFPGALFIREGYGEMFYPPTLGYLATAIGIILTSFALLDLKPQLKIYAPLREMGKASLGMYILHLLIIRFFLEIFWPAQPFINFATIYFVLMVFLVGCAYGLRLIRKTWPKRPHAIKSFIG
jgi:uncharacterized membrane protein